MYKGDKMKTNNKISSFMGGLIIAFAIALFTPTAAQATWGNHNSGTSTTSTQCDTYKAQAKKYLNAYYRCYNYTYYRYYIYYMKKYKQCQSNVSTTPNCNKYKDLANRYLAAYYRCGYYCYYRYYCYYLNLYKKCEANLNKTGNIAGKVFEDTNANGSFEKDTDKSLANVSVTITDSKGKVQTVKTNSRGYYYANSIAAGTAKVDIVDSTLPDNPSQVVGTDPTDVDVKAGVNNWEEHNGYVFPVPTGKVCGTVYEDINGNGQQDDNETGKAGIVVKIIDANSEKQTETTNDAGKYCFATVVEGSASIEVDVTTLPQDATLTAGKNPNSIDVEANIANQAGTDGYTLPTPVGSACGYVLVDGQGQASVTVTLMDSEANTHSEVTDADGKYCFTDIPQGDATVDVDDTTLPDGAELTSGEDPSDVNVLPNTENDAGTDEYTLPTPVGAVCGSVVVDGQGQADVTVNVTDSNGDVYPETTDADGKWCAKNLPEGDATIDVDEATLPDGIKRVLGEDQDVYQVIANENTDAGIDGYETIPTGSVTGFVYQDFFSDGEYNANDEPISGVPVTITINGETFDTVTGANGKYTLNDIPVGDATITIDENYITDQYPNAVQTAGLNPSPVTIVKDTLTDAGEDGYSYRQCGFIKGFVYLDTNGDGQYTNGTDTPLEGIRVSLQIVGHSSSPLEVTTNQFGLWSECIFKPQGTKVTATVNLSDLEAIYGNITQSEGLNPNTVTIDLGVLTDAGTDGYKLAI